MFGFELVQNSQLSCMGLIGLNLSISVFELTSKPNKTKKKMNNDYDQLINWFQHPHCHYWHHVFECRQSSTTVVQLEAVLHTECYFTDTTLKARLFPWPLPFISCPF